MSVNPPPGPVSVLRGHRKDVQSIDFTPEGSCIVAGDAEGEVQSPNSITLFSSIILTEKLFKRGCIQSSDNVLCHELWHGHSADVYDVPSRHCVAFTGY